MTVRDHFVYRTYDIDGQLLYVGCTKRIDKRWAEHKCERRGMVDATVRCRLQGPYTREKAYELERIAIRTEEPLIGFTPTRHREKCARDKWIDRRAEELCAAGINPYTASSQAVADAKEWFPDPDEHERAYRMGAAK